MLARNTRRVGPPRNHIGPRGIALLMLIFVMRNKDCRGVSTVITNFTAGQLLWDIILKRLVLSSMPLFFSDTAGLAGATNTVEASPPTVAPALEVNDVSSPDVFPNTAPPFAHGVFAPEGGVAAVSVPVVGCRSQTDPIFYRTHLQQLAENRDLRALASAIRACAPLNFCPECGQWCAQSVYITRHASAFARKAGRTVDAGSR